MAESKNRWTWEVPGFEPRRTPTAEGDVSGAACNPPVVQRLSVSPSTWTVRSPSPQQLPRQSPSTATAVRFQKLEDQVKCAREDYLDLKQEATDLKEYSNAKLDRVIRYIGVLAERVQRLDHAALETEARITPLINEKKRLFNDLVSAKGNVQVFCRVRPLFEDEGPSIAEYPNDFTIRVDTGDDSLANPKKDYEFDRVYGPHVRQGELFHDIQPFVQSALDGFNISIFAYGQSLSGKTHTLEGSSHDRGLYLRSFEELFDISNSDSTSISKYIFYVSAFELYNEQVQDLLKDFQGSKALMGLQGSSVELVLEKVDNPLDFSRVLKAALQNRNATSLRAIYSHMYAYEMPEVKFSVYMTKFLLVC